jgi:hypothetical protein
MISWSGKMDHMNSVIVSLYFFFCIFSTYFKTGAALRCVPLALIWLRSQVAKVSRFTAPLPEYETRFRAYILTCLQYVSRNEITFMKVLGDHAGRNEPGE